MKSKTNGADFASDDADATHVNLPAPLSFVSKPAMADTIASASRVATSATGTAGAGHVSSAPVGGGALSLAEASAIAQTDMKSGGLSKLDTQLAALFYEHSSAAEATAMSSFVSDVSQFGNAVTGDGQYVLVDATAADRDGAALLAEMQTLGLQAGSSFGAVVSGWLPTTSLGQLAATANLGFAHESMFSTSTGSVTTQADHAEAADTARSTYSVTGAGLRIGVISNSFDSKSHFGATDTMATDIASNDLPTDTHVLQDDIDSSYGTDEGRGMAQLVHDLAPGASIDFATGAFGMANFANNILKLAAAGDKVIVDDLIYYEEPAYQDGIVAQAVNQVAAQGVSYFSAAGNNADTGYEGAWKAGGTFSYGNKTYTLMNFAPGQDYIEVTNINGVYFTLKWDSPAASAGGLGATNDLDLFLEGSDGSIKDLSIDNNINGDPFEIVGVTGAASTTTYRLVVGLASGSPAPGTIKLLAFGNGRAVTLGTLASNTNDGTMYGHAAAAGAVAVGAASFSDTPAYGVTTPVPEYFSSRGTDHILFANDGTRLATSRTATIALTAVDNGNTTFFGRDSPVDTDTLPNFNGTSAAAPDAAAVAALMLQARSALTPTDIRYLLQDSAIPMTDATISGTGLIQADKAVGFATSLVISNAAQTELDGTHLNDTITGNSLNNILRGYAGDDTITAGAGADTVDGAGGNDILFGNGGVDTLHGGAGNDTIDGGAGNDIMDGGADTDTASYASAPSAVTVSLALQGQAQNTIGAGTDTLTNFENLTGSAYNDTLSGDGNANLIHGGSGDDVIMAGAGADTVYGDPGNDTLYGNGGADILYGNGGADRLIGGAGADTLTGGAGNDTFVYLLATDSTPSAPDLITDFTHGSDKIDLTALHTSAKDTFAITSSGGITTISVDLGGNGTVDTLIRLTGTNVVAASDVLWTTSASPAAQAADGHALVTVAHGHLATSLHAVALDHATFA